MKTSTVVDDVDESLYSVFQIVLIAPVVANDAVLRVRRAVEAIFDVVVPNYGLTEQGNNPEAVAECVVWFKLPFPVELEPRPTNGPEVGPCALPHG